jgi:carbamoyl-phosphate synthase small subunit
MIPAKFQVLSSKNSDIASRAGASGRPSRFLVRDHIAGICDIDTRALVRHIRKAGAMNCIISSDDLDIEALQKKLSRCSFHGWIGT